MNRKAGMVLLLGVASVFPAEVAAQNIFQKAANTISSWFSTDEKKTDVPAQHIDITQLTLDENISIPELDGKEARKIRAAQSREMKRLRKARLTHLELIRNYEVIKATLAASNLFLPNDTVLSDKADLFLRPFLSDLRIPDYYHVMLVMHSDDTGNAAYNYSLTTQRVLDIFDWFERNGAATDFLIPYAAGSHEPLVPNNSTENRYRNRRLEVYLIPGEAMFK